MLICGVLRMEYDTSEAAERSAERYGGCPKVIFWATRGESAYVLIVVPEEELFWAEYIRDHPGETFGGTRAELVFADRVHLPELGLRVPDVLGDSAPCGSHCAGCPAHGSPCPGCPATVHYRA